ncbi:MAG TPA: LLM class flavin-dependent oxidoreductase [Reyranellaceae bacterium]|nr:LLM class flavin-dependent oxidoreductase [Reyranellaceae bacterium]
MKFGIFDHMDRSGPDIGRQYEERLKLIQLYEWAGFHAYHVAEHHSTPLGMAPSPSVFLAAVAQRTRTLRFGPLVYTLNLYHPLRLIDEICMLDQMSGGRLELGVGRGVSPHETAYYGIDPKLGQERFEEMLQVLLKGLGNRRLTHKGKHFQFDDVPMELQPAQAPHPPLWQASRSPESAHKLARQGCNVALSLPTRDAGEFVARYRAAWAALGRDPEFMPFVGTVRNFVVADTDGEAISAAKRAFDVWYTSLCFLWRKHGIEPPRAVFPPEFEEAVEDGYIIAGSPSTVRDAMRKADRVSGINYSICRLAYGDLSFEEAGRSIELFAREVMPAFSRLPANDEKPAMPFDIAGFPAAGAYARADMATNRVVPSL